MNEDLLEPITSYNTKYKDKFKENTEKYFDELAKKGQVNVDENRSTIKKINEETGNISNLSKKLGKFRGLKIFMIIVLIIFFAAAIITWNAFKDNKLIPILVTVAGGIYFIAFILLLVLVINKKVKALKNDLASHEEEKDKLINEAKCQMAGLNALYDWNIPATLITNTIDLIKMDKYFDAEKYQYLHDKYGFGVNQDNNVSTYYVQSGSILGNPFLICKDYRMDMIQKTYTGSLTIHWTTYRSTKNGTVAVHHTQTLTASITAPAPSYGYVTYLIYGNDAAPKLSFSRMPVVDINDNEKQIDKYVQKHLKDLDKKEKDSLAAFNKTGSGNVYTRLGNDEFEVLFGGTNRNNEMEYRLLMTPLAQRNLLKLIKSKEPYGDDFGFVKENQLNMIQSRHSQVFNYYANPASFIDYDYDRARANFISYNTKYFESFFFDLAPLLSIPLYQQHKSVDYIYNNSIKANFSPYEHEALANSFDSSFFKHKDSSTGNIYKTNYIGSDGKVDKVQVTAYSFKALRRLTYITKFGRDGHYHQVPVYWIEYIPVQNDTNMIVEKNDLSRYNYNVNANTDAFRNAISRIIKTGGTTFERGIFAAVLAGDMAINSSAIESSLNQVVPETDFLTDVANKVMEFERELEKMDSETQSSGTLEASALEDQKAEEVAEDKVNVVAEENADDSEDTEEESEE